MSIISQMVLSRLSNDDLNQPEHLLALVRVIEPGVWYDRTGTYHFGEEGPLCEHNLPLEQNGIMYDTQAWRCIKRRNACIGSVNNQRLLTALYHFFPELPELIESSAPEWSMG